MWSDEGHPCLGLTVSADESPPAMAMGRERNEPPRSGRQSEARAAVQPARSDADQPGPGSRHRPEVYTHGYGVYARDWMSQRTAAQAADFLIPHLRPGMRLLDCGCGPGSISADLASVVAPGKVIGIDIEPRQLEVARTLAAVRGVDNVEFQLANIYDLPFPEASFDAVFAHTVVEHLAEPRSAFAEVRRVLKPGGIFGVRDPDYGAWRMEPATARVRDFGECVRRVQQINGGSPTTRRASGSCSSMLDLPDRRGAQPPCTRPDPISWRSCRSSWRNR
jgi:SAM-dependent methyltransferase